MGRLINPLTNQNDSMTNKSLFTWQTPHVLANRQLLLPWRRRRRHASCLSQHVCHSLHRLNSVGLHSCLSGYDYYSNLPAPSQMKTPGRSRHRAPATSMWVGGESFPHVKPQRLHGNRRSGAGMYEGLAVVPENDGDLDAQTGLFSFSSFLCAFSTVFVFASGKSTMCSWNTC